MTLAIGPLGSRITVSPSRNLELDGIANISFIQVNSLMSDDNVTMKKTEDIEKNDSGGVPSESFPATPLCSIVSEVIK